MPCGLIQALKQDKKAGERGAAGFTHKPRRDEGAGFNLCPEFSLEVVAVGQLDVFQVIVSIETRSETTSA